MKSEFEMIGFMLVVALFFIWFLFLPLYFWVWTKNIKYESELATIFNSILFLIWLISTAIMLLYSVTSSGGQVGR